MFIFFSLILCTSASPPWRSLKAFSTLPEPELAVVALRSEEQGLGAYGYLDRSETRKFSSQPHRFVLVEDSNRDDQGTLYVQKRISLYERVLSRSNPYRPLGYVDGDRLASPTHNRPYLVYHLSDAICGEDLSETNFDPYLIAFAVASHKLDQSERGSYDLILSYNVKTDNVRWQAMLGRNGFQSWSSLDADLQTLVFDVYKGKQYLHLGKKGSVWSTFFCVVRL
jgi:hypothetical protein